MTVIPIPFADPVAAFAPWADRPWAMLLDSAAPCPERGRFAYLALAPFRTLVAGTDGVRVDGSLVDGDPFTVLQRELAAHAAALPPGAPAPFAGGAVGLLGYELGRWLERAPARHRPPPGEPEMAVGLYDVVAVYDVVDRRAWVVASRPQAVRRAAALARQLECPPDLPPLPDLPAAPWSPAMGRDTYLARIGRIVEYIRAGDVFQVNFTQRFTARRPAGLSDFAFYRALRHASPAPFATFLRCGPHLTLAGASPERFLRLSADGSVEARPIKGSRPRGATPAADAAAAAALVASAKDRAENLMITDLLRNDIGRVAELGSVRVPVLAGVESFARLHHLVSVVEGRLRPGLDAVDLLRATFPGGSITGAPKVRAMEIIDELEPAHRGAYCGAAGWIGFDGAMDTCVVIRSLTITPGRIVCQAGGGIVADSDPQAEYEEMMAKAAPALAVLNGGGFP